MAPWGLTGGAAVFLMLVLFVPFLRNLFQFGPPHRWEFALIAVASLGSLIVSESVKKKPMRRVIPGK
jgi:hypothetical protein